MIRLRRPTAETIRSFLAQQAMRDFTYPAVGATMTTPPARYVVDHTRIRLGAGERVFAAARQALEQWQQFRLGWVETYPPYTPIKKGQVVAILAHILGLWWLNASRIVLVIDEAGPVRRFGFAYGTLPGHAESGEERFLIEWDQPEGSVYYDILAFSRPRHVLARLGHPLARYIQKLFARHSTAAMGRFVQAGADEPQ
jgi:uncharacterized protein (UPF0548 family)